MRVTWEIDLDESQGDQSLAVMHAAESAIEEHPGVKSVTYIDHTTND